MAAAKRRNFDLESPKIYQVGATTAFDISAQNFNGPGNCCRMIELLAAGNLEYTDPDGVTQTLTGLSAGKREIQAQAIGAATSVGILIYM